MTTIKINRAPVMTLWAVVVAERLGFDTDEALTLGKAVAGLNAQSKGQRLGIYEPPAERQESEKEKARRYAPGEEFSVELMGRAIPATHTGQGTRATQKDEPIDPQSVQRYLEKKFGSSLAEARKAMEALAASFPPAELARRAYPLYEKFRPEIPEGTRGWGAAGDLDLEALATMGKR